MLIKLRHMEGEEKRFIANSTFHLSLVENWQFIVCRYKAVWRVI